MFFREKFSSVHLSCANQIRAIASGGRDRGGGGGGGGEERKKNKKWKIKRSFIQLEFTTMINIEQKLVGRRGKGDDVVRQELRTVRGVVRMLIQWSCF